MPRRRFSVVILLVPLVACTGSGGGIGDACGGHDDCDGLLQCVTNQCVPKCDRAPDCGDGYGCDEHGYCIAGTRHAGEPCAAEWQCATGFSCQIGDTINDENQLNTTCARETGTRPEGAACDSTDDCRNGTCAFGQCIALCAESHDCASGRSCVDIPHPLLSTKTYKACLPERGAVSWSIPMSSPSGELLLPVPAARSLELVMSVNDPGQKVGAAKVFGQTFGTDLYDLPCTPGPADPECTEATALDMYYNATVRHLPAFGQSVLLIPSSGAGSIGPNVYRVTVSSFRPDNSPGSAIPHVTAVVQLSAAMALDLHFFFLDLADHPCAAMTDHATLDATSAPNAAYFTGYLDQLSNIFRDSGITVRTLTYENITSQPKLDTLDIANAGELFALGTYRTGINVFFVRSLSPIGLQAFGPNPGPAGLAGTRESGIVIGLDTLCYRDWSSLARLTAHELARYMGLYHNVELENPGRGDLITDDDADPIRNLMHFSEFAGSTLSPGQIEILTRSPALQ